MTIPYVTTTQLWIPGAEFGKGLLGSIQKSGDFARTLLMEVARLSAAVELEEEVDVYVRPGPRMSYTAGPQKPFQASYCKDLRHGQIL